jgi:predicted small metal-binding protein
MVKEVSCIHAGFEDCEFLVRSENEPELIEFVQQHAEKTHDVSVSQDHVKKIMREV